MLKKYTIEKFDLNKIAPPNVVLILGKKLTGKTVLVREILDHFNYTDGLIIHPDETRKGGYGDLNVALTATLSTMSANVDNIEHICNFYNERKGQTNKPPPSFLVLDNCPTAELYNAHLHKKWANSLLIMAQQYAYPVLNKPDYLFIYYTPILNERKMIYDYYIATNPASSEAAVTFEVFCKMLDACTATRNNYECLVFETITKKMYWYKAAMLSKPIVQCPITLGRIVDEYEQNTEFRNYVHAYFN